MKKKSNQRITKIKRDVILELLKRAEGTSVENGTSIQTAGSDLTPYPDLNNLRLWTRDYLLKGINKVYPIRLDADGQTYLTTILDGLTMYTKMTKSLTEVKEEEWTQPVLSSNGTLGGDTYAASANSDSAAAYEAFDGNDTTGCYGDIITFYSPNPIKLTSADISFINTAARFNNVTIDASNDNSTWTNVASATNSSTSLTVYIDTQGNSYKYYRYTFTNRVGIYVFDININQHGTIISELSVETTKPGLWLSNLSQIYSDSSAGGWLRQNLNSTSNSLTDVNSDTLGNYSYSFLQRSIIKRDAGSQHDNNDSFIMHWSPSAKSCIANDAIIIPTNNLRSTYTTYQTMVTPTDVNMQTYEEVVSKNINFNFSDAYQSGETATTAYNGRIVGKDWSYEFIVRPNFSGSGLGYTGQTRCCDADDAGCIGSLDCSGADSVCPECASDDTRSNGVCIEGQLTYNDIENNPCVQLVNNCYVPYQAQQNPNANQSTSTPINGTTSSLLTRCSHTRTYKGTEVGSTVPSLSDYFYWFLHNNNSASGDRISKVEVTAKIDTDKAFATKMQETGLKIDITAGASSQSYRYCNWSNFPSGVTYDSNAMFSEGDNFDGYIIKPNSTSGSVTIIPNTNDVGDGADYIKGLELKLIQVRTFNSSVTTTYGGGTVDFTLTAYTEVQPQNNVNIYLNILDVKKMYENAGIPYEATCDGRPRFDIEVSTNDMSQYGNEYTSIKLYENVNINNLGDISGLGLNSITLSN